jgi:uncharacterized Ntn-hydrolase superfamily protein
MPPIFDASQIMTYSIIGRDPAAGDLGIAVQSRYFAAGRLVPFAEAGVGVIASQAFGNPAHGPEGLRLLRAGLEPQAVLQQLLSNDAAAATRQLAVLDARGRIAVHTGAGCVAAAGHSAGANCCAQANMMARGTVWAAMVHAFEHTHGALADRLVAAMDAAEHEGGDVRGRQAAALIVVSERSSGPSPLDRTVDLRIDDHPQPINEIRRQLQYSRANAQANRAVEKIRANDFAGALADLDSVCSSHPDEPEFLVRRALVLLPLGRTNEARTDLRRAKSIHAGWIELVLRFADAGVIPVARAALEPLVSDLGQSDTAAQPRPASEQRAPAGTPAA